MNRINLPMALRYAAHQVYRPTRNAFRFVHLIQYGLVALAITSTFLFGVVQVDAGSLTAMVSMGSFSPNPVREKLTDQNGEIFMAGTTTLNASYSNLNPTPSSEANLSAGYSWSVSNVQYSSTKDGTYGDPPDASYSYSILHPADANATLYFTPDIGGYWKVSTSCSISVEDKNSDDTWGGSGSAGPKTLTSYIIDIVVEHSTLQSDGTILGKGDTNIVATNKTVDVHAGWPVDLKAIYQPTDLAPFTWKIQDAGGNGKAAVAGYSPSSGATSVTVLNPGQHTDKTFPRYYYIKAGSFTASVTPTSSMQTAAQTTFSTTKPAITVSTTTGTVAFDSQYPNVPPPALHDGMPVVGQTPGIHFTATTIPTGYNGSVVWVQIYTANDVFKDANGSTTTRNGTGLDTSWPYGSDPNLGQGQYGTDDSPAVSTSYIPNMSYMEIDDTPTMYLLYSPNAPHSIDVPIQKVSWSWSGSVTLQNGQWVTSGLNNATNPSGVNINSEPEWSGLAP